MFKFSWFSFSFSSSFPAFSQVFQACPRCSQMIDPFSPFYNFLVFRVLSLFGAQLLSSYKVLGLQSSVGFHSQLFYRFWYLGPFIKIARICRSISPYVCFIRSFLELFNYAIQLFSTEIDVKLTQKSATCSMFQVPNWKYQVSISRIQVAMSRINFLNSETRSKFQDKVYTLRIPVCKVQVPDSMFWA